jgi:AP-1 complex subunit beta-1
MADVVKNMQTEDLEMKKLVYLYLMNYAKSNPELVILAVNTFVKVGLGLRNRFLTIGF